MSEARPYVTLKRAARALGVHEQTLRSWEKRGLIRMIRLPGSGYRRVPIEEIERLQDEMNTLPAPGSGVRIVPPHRDAESLAQGRALADTVCAELDGLESTTTFDEFMGSLRGRTWSS
jgi:DNA-binding transcriptional MerR regulator